MFGLAIAVLMPAALLIFSRVLVPPEARRRVALLLCAGYVVRLGIQVFSREIPFFTAGPIGDWYGYEQAALTITKLWSYNGIHYVTATELPDLNAVTLPSNLFALVFYINGEATRLGCTAIIAAIGCLTCLGLYLVARTLGAGDRPALTTAGAILFMPSFLLYTSDMFKDGIICFCVVLTIGCAVRLARGFSLLLLALGLLGVLGVYLTRYYLAFILVTPLLIGCLGVGSGSGVRPVITVLVLMLLAGTAVSYTSTPAALATEAAETFERGTSRQVVLSNADSGSGVTFDDAGSPYGALPTKLLYTLFSPFPWQSGSMAFQIGKLEALVWYFLVYRIIVSFGVLWRKHRGDLFIMLSFVIPTIFTYALAFSNVGLNLRERIGLVMISALLATLTWPSTISEAEKERGLMPEAASARVG